MTILDTLPVRVRQYRTRSVSDVMLRDPLWAWQAITAPAARTAQISYVRHSPFSYTSCKIFLATVKPFHRATASQRRLPALASNATNEPAVERFVCDGAAIDRD